MRIQGQQRGAAPPSTKEQVTTAVARGRRRTGPLAITAAVAFGALLSLVIVSSSRGGPALQTTTHPSTVASASVSNADAVPSTRLQRAVRWVDGLAAGTILPSDITSRLEAQDPRMVKVVMTTWSDLNAVTTSD